MFMDVFEDAMFELRRHWKKRALIPLAIIGVCLIIGGIAVGVAWFASNQGKPPKVNSEDIPLGSYAAGNIEVLDCIYRGPDDCGEYKKSKDWMISGVDDLTYTPNKGDDNAPGEKTQGGALKVDDLKSLSDEEWHALAAGMTKNGRANPGTVTENSVDTSGFDPGELSASASFTLPEKGDDREVEGTLTFTLKDSGVTLKGLTYGEEG